MTTEGYFSVLRWRHSATRDEAKNVAVLLVDRDGQTGGIRHAPISSVSPRLHDQGILDAVLVQLERQFDAPRKPNLGTLVELHESMVHSLYLTEPRPTAVPDTDLVLHALYKAIVAPTGGGSGALTKGRVLDGVVRRLRSAGADVKRGSYLGNFLFDAIVDAARDVAPPTAVEVLSFATTAQRWAPVEHDAAHFLYAIDRLDIPGIAVVQAPADNSHRNAVESFERINGWLESEKVPTVTPDEVATALAL